MNLVHPVGLCTYDAQDDNEIRATTFTFQQAPEYQHQRY
jgi:hypothetical protein